VLTLPLPIACPELDNKPLFSAFIMSVYLAFRHRWPDLAYRISGVCVLGPKLRFHYGSFKQKTKTKRPIETALRKT
jgi:hypothetical protein